MEEKIEKIIDSNIGSDESGMITGLVYAAKEIKEHVMGFTVWFKEDDNFMKCYIGDEIRYLDRNRYDDWTTAPQPECYLTLNEVYQYWINNVYNK